MFLTVTVVFVIIGAAATREPDIDINRVRLVYEEAYGSDQSSSHERRSTRQGNQLGTNDYVGYSSRQFGLHSPLQLHDSSYHTSTKTPLKVYQPREDPRLFYQSDAYLKEHNGQNVNQEVTFIYPGRDSIQARELDDKSKSMPLRVKNREPNLITDASNFCVRCPRDRTIIAKAGSDRVLLQAPRLVSCSGHKAPKSFRFVQMYGPKFGSIIEHGSHMIIGRIMNKNKSIHICKMQVVVVAQDCLTPKHLLSHCADRACNFTCRDSVLELHGHSSLICGADMKWNGEPPICRARNWCEAPSPPEHGRIVCKTSSSGVGYSKCRLRCARGYRGHPRAIAICRHGAWTNSLSCQKTNKY